MHPTMLNIHINIKNISILIFFIYINRKNYCYMGGRTVCYWTFRTRYFATGYLVTGHFVTREFRD